MCIRDSVYSPQEKMFYTKQDSYIVAWDFSDPSTPPEEVWSTYVPGGGIVGSGVHYGDGIIFLGSFESHQMALDAKTGDVLWDTETKNAMLFFGSYYEGKFFLCHFFGLIIDNTNFKLLGFQDKL